VYWVGVQGIWLLLIDSAMWLEAQWLLGISGKH
jgi:hypothetical protein